MKPSYLVRLHIRSPFTSHPVQNWCTVVPLNWLDRRIGLRGETVSTTNGITFDPPPPIALHPILLVHSSFFPQPEARRRVFLSPNVPGVLRGLNRSCGLSCRPVFRISVFRLRPSSSVLHSPVSFTLRLLRSLSRSLIRLCSSRMRTSSGSCTRDIVYVHFRLLSSRFPFLCRRTVMRISYRDANQRRYSALAIDYVRHCLLYFEVLNYVGRSYLRSFHWDRQLTIRNCGTLSLTLCALYCYSGGNVSQVIVIIN